MCLDELMKRCWVDLRREAIKIPSGSQSIVKSELTPVILDKQLISSSTPQKSRTRRNTPKLIECSRCTQVFGTEQDMIKHVFKKHKPWKKCEFCHRPYNYKYSKNHMKMYHKNLVRCSHHHCSTYFRSVEEKQNHEKLLHSSGIRQKCIFCGRHYLKYRYKEHLTTVHKSQLSQAFKCPFEKCLGYFLTETERDLHIKRIHGSELLGSLEVVKCIYCNKLYAKKSCLHKHVKACHLSVSFRCKFRTCMQYFLTKSDLGAHLDQVHQEIENKKRFGCSECNFRSDSIGNFKKHLTVMHGLENN